MKTKQGGTKMYCPACKLETYCEVLSLKSIAIHTGQRRCTKSTTDIHWFSRARQCHGCHKIFMTAEFDEEFLHELIDLRNQVALLKTAYAEIAKNLAINLRSLSSLGVQITPERTELEQTKIESTQEVDDFNIDDFVVPEITPKILAEILANEWPEE